VIRLHKVWVLQEAKKDIGTMDLYQEYDMMRKHLENNVRTLREKLYNDKKNHQKENKRILKENVTLIQEINHLKIEKHTLEQ